MEISIKLVYTIFHKAENPSKCEGTTMHMLLKCKKVKILWKIVERIIFYIFQKQVEINERIMIIGFNISEKKNLMINLIINFAQFIIYRNYVKTSWEKRNDKVNPKQLWIDLKVELRQYLSCKYIRGRENSGDIDRVLEHI